MQLCKKFLFFHFKDDFIVSVCAGGQQGNVQPFSDEDASIETLSHCSSLSERTSAAEEGGYSWSHLFFYSAMQKLLCRALSEKKATLSSSHSV